MSILEFPSKQRIFSPEQLNHARKEAAIEMQRQCVEVLEAAREEMLNITRTEHNRQAVDAVLVNVISRVRNM